MAECEDVAAAEGWGVWAWGAFDAAGAGWDAGEVGVDEAERVVVGEGEAAGEELVEGDAEGVVVAAGVDLATGAAGLFGGHVLQGALAVAGVAVAGEGGGGEVDEDDAAVGGDDDVAGLDVAVEDAGGVDDGEGADEAEGEVEALEQVGGAAGAADPGAERGAVDDGEDQRGGAVPVVEGEGADDLGGADAAQEGELLFDAIGEAEHAGAQVLDDDGEAVAASTCAQDPARPALVEHRLDLVVAGRHALPSALPPRAPASVHPPWTGAVGRVVLRAGARAQVQRFMDRRGFLHRRGHGRVARVWR